VRYDPLLLKAVLLGTRLPNSAAARDVKEIVGTLEVTI
jgi:hypothetical protein